MRYQSALRNSIVAAHRHLFAESGNRLVVALQPHLALAPPLASTRGSRLQQLCLSL